MLQSAVASTNLSSDVSSHLQSAIKSISQYSTLNTTSLPPTPASIPTPLSPPDVSSPPQTQASKKVRTTESLDQDHSMPAVELFDSRDSADAEPLMTILGQPVVQTSFSAPQ